MLLVHPSSQCDVCLDPYTWATPSKSPHAIQCGHVFCLDCLRSVHPTNCPLCRKGFNPERIKKLHVDKVNGDGSGPARPMADELELYRRIGTHFHEHANPEDINTIVEEVNSWFLQSNGAAQPAESHPLRTTVTALHQYRSLQVERAKLKEDLGRLRATHERHVTIKNKDIQTAMLVERGMIEADAQRTAELEHLREENARLQEELRRRTHPSNPLPRPPQLSQSVAQQLAQQSTTFHNGLATTNGASDTIANMPPMIGISDESSAQVAEPATVSRNPRYRVTSAGEVLRQENRRRSHLVVPGAPSSKRIIPPTEVDNGLPTTPRASAAVPIPPAMNMWAGPDWPHDSTDVRPSSGEECMWQGLDPFLKAKFPGQTSSAYPPAGQPSAWAVAGERPQVLSDQPPVINAQPPAPTREMQGVRTPFPTRSARMPVDPPEGPVSGRSPLDWRPGPAHRPGYVMAYIPETGICWIPEKQASKMPVRARGTESRYGYVIAKEPSEVDEEWRNVRNGGSPGPNPLQLTGVPESVTAGPSNGAIEREEEEGPVPAVRDEAMLFRSQPAATGRSTAGNLPGPSAPLAASVPADSHPVSSALRVGLTTHVEQGQSTTARPAAQTRVPDNSLPAPSPATSWGGSYQPSRRSSLSLQLNNLPSPQDIPESGELQSIHDSVGVSVNFFPDRTSVSIRSERDQRPPGLLLDSREGSSRQVVTGLRDLEDVNRSLSSVERSSQRDAQSVRSAAPSRQSHSRQHSVSSYDTDVHVGPRTGLALYGSRPATHYSGGHLTAEPLPTQPLVSSSTRSQSRTSLRSRAESTHSSSHSVSSQRSSGQRPRRTSTTSSAPLRDPYERPPSSWGAELVGTQVYSSRGPYSNSRPQTSQDSIPRSLESIGGGFGGGGGGSLLLSFEAPSTSSAVDRHGEAAAGIHAPRPVSSRHSSMFNGAWNARNGR